jgi:hypothetical protein
MLGIDLRQPCAGERHLWMGGSDAVFWNGFLLRIVDANALT